MTKRRVPDTFQEAMTKVLAQIGADEAARVMTELEAVHRTKKRHGPYKARSMHEWSDPDTGTLPTLLQALALDTAHRLAGGEDAPFRDAFTQQLDIKVEQEDACRRQLVADSLQFIRESADLQGALFTAAQPGASPLDHHRALVEAQEVESVLRRIRRRLPGFLRPVTSTGPGNAGGSHQ